MNTSTKFPCNKQWKILFSYLLDTSILGSFIVLLAGINIFIVLIMAAILDMLMETPYGTTIKKNIKFLQCNNIMSVKLIVKLF